LRLAEIIDDVSGEFTLILFAVKHEDQGVSYLEPPPCISASVNLWGVISLAPTAKDEKKYKASIIID
jgi:hypothetical protein